VQDRFHSLTRINLEDLTLALGLQNRPCAAWLARLLLRGPAQAFARQMLEFDEITGTRGLPEGARHAERLLARDVRVYGRENLPPRSFLALSNHPGLTDTLALFAALDRDDVKTIALERPFLVNLVHVSKQLMYLPDEPGRRIALIREASRALREGAAVLTFPAGHIEPDPEVVPGAIESLETWTASAEVFARLAPGCPIVPVCVRGVTWGFAAQHPLTHIRKSSADRQLLASALQLLWQLIFGLRPVTVKVQIGKPILVGAGSRLDPDELHSAVLAEMRRLIELDPVGEGESAL
jgi:1-acyl-sn-glycerol-3-phosphate acyltransferase